MNNVFFISALTRILRFFTALSQTAVPQDTLQLETGILAKVKASSKYLLRKKPPCSLIQSLSSNDDISWLAVFKNFIVFCTVGIALLLIVKVLFYAPSPHLE